MKRPGRDRRSSGGFTFIELLVGMTIGSIALAGVAVVSISLQRAFEAANYQITAQNDQLRVFDYLSRDLRMAASVSILNGGGKITVTVPSTDPSLVQLNLGPLLGLLGSTAAAGASPTTTASYYEEGGQFIREVGGVQTDLADTIADVQFTQQGLFVTTSIVFTPRFSSSPTAAAQEATRATGTVCLRNATLTN